MFKASEEVRLIMQAILNIEKSSSDLGSKKQMALDRLSSGNVGKINRPLRRLTHAALLQTAWTETELVAY
jgi:hypothetical protein